MTWPKVNLNDICRPKQWPTIATNQMKDSGYPVYGANGKIGFYDTYTHELPTILITCRGATCGTINVCEPRSYVNGNAMALDNLDEQRVTLHFLHRYLNHRGLADTISGSAQPQITRIGLQNLEIPLPPIAEQKRLASILDAADALRQQRRETLRVLDELAQSLFLELFGDPATNPKGWEVVKLGDVIKDATSGFASGQNLDEGLAQVRMNNITTSGEFVFDSIRRVPSPKNVARVLIETDDILFNSTNSPNLVGKCALFRSFAEPLTFSNHFLRLRPKPDLANGDYLHSVLLRFFSQGRFEMMCTRWVNQASVRRDDLLEIEIPLPPLALQQQFASQIEELEAIKRRARESSTRLDALFACLQARAFAGELSE